MSLQGPAQIPLLGQLEGLPCRLTALDIASILAFEGIPLLGIDIGASSGVAKASVGSGFPDFKMRVHPI